jgi:hypothetical protein
MGISAELAKACKVVYEKRLIDTVFRRRPLLALLPKDESWGGDGTVVSPVKYGIGPGGGSATFATAQANMAFNRGIAKFITTRYPNYSMAKLTREEIKASKDNMAAFADLLDMRIKDALKDAGDFLGRVVFATGTPIIGQLASFSTGVSTFVDLTGTAQIEVGMVLVVCDAATSTAVTAGSAVGYVISVDRSWGAQTFTISTTATGAAGTPTGWTSGLYVARAGDLGVALHTGLRGWLPTTVGGSDSFAGGVNRSYDRTRLAGVYIDLSSYSLDEALKYLVSATAQNGGDPKYTIVHPDTFDKLDSALGSKVHYEKAEIKMGEATIGFGGIRISGGGAESLVLADPGCGATDAYAIDPSTWKVKSLGPAVGLLDYSANDGGLITVSTEDAEEIRVGGYYNIVGLEPGGNGRALISA